MALPTSSLDVYAIPISIFLWCQQSTLQALETCLKTVLSVSAKDIGSQVGSVLLRVFNVNPGPQPQAAPSLLQMDPLQQASMHLALAQSVSVIYQTFLRLHGSNLENNPFAKDMVGASPQIRMNPLVL